MSCLIKDLKDKNDRVDEIFTTGNKIIHDLISEELKTKIEGARNPTPVQEKYTELLLVTLVPPLERLLMTPPLFGNFSNLRNHHFKSGALF